jgi:retron-type reverse transcriptase
MRVPVHDAARGYVRKKSIVDHAVPHVGSKEVLTVDLRNFFPSIKFARVFAIFRDIGYTRDVSFSLARLCCLDGALPQGAPTSPNLSNIVCRRLDFRISRMCQRLGVSYTRYADDLCFSGDSIPASLLHSLNAIIQSEGFDINENKTRMHSKTSNRKMVTGLNVAHSGVRLPQDYKRAISLDLYHIERHGLLSHLAKRKITDPAYLSKLLGKVGFWLQIEPENSLAARHKEVLKTFISQ